MARFADKGECVINSIALETVNHRNPDGGGFATEEEEDCTTRVVQRLGMNQG